MSQRGYFELTLTLIFQKKIIKDYSSFFVSVTSWNLLSVSSLHLPLKSLILCFPSDPRSDGAKIFSFFVLIITSDFQQSLYALICDYLGLSILALCRRYYSPKVYSDWAKSKYASQFPRKRSFWWLPHWPSEIREWICTSFTVPFDTPL